MIGKTILEKEEAVKKIKSKLKSCNDGRCHISRQGKSHLKHNKINKSHIGKAVTSLVSVEILLLIITIIVEEHHNPINNITIFLAAIPFAIFTIWYSTQLHQEQKQNSEFLQHTQAFNQNMMKEEWKEATNNAKLALEYEPFDISLLNGIGRAHMNLEEYAEALISFEQIRKII